MSARGPDVERETATQRSLTWLSKASIAVAAGEGWAVNRGPRCR